MVIGWCNHVFLILPMRVNNSMFTIQLPHYQNVSKVQTLKSRTNFPFIARYKTDLSQQSYNL